MGHVYRVDKNIEAELINIPNLIENIANLKGRRVKRQLFDIIHTLKIHYKIFTHLTLLFYNFLLNRKEALLILCIGAKFLYLRHWASKRNCIIILS